MLSEEEKKRGKRKEEIAELEMATRQVIYHIFAREFGYRRLDVDRMRLHDIECELKLIEEDFHAVHTGDKT